MSVALNFQPLLTCVFCLAVNVIIHNLGKKNFHTEDNNFSVNYNYNNNVLKGLYDAFFNDHYLV